MAVSAGSCGRPSTACEAQYTNNLKLIGLALHNYHDMHPSFPPVYIADKNGKPLHSWRVLLLPLVGENDLFASFDFNVA